MAGPAGSSRKRRWQSIVGLVISGGTLVLALIGIDIRRVVETLARADYRYLVPAAGAVVAYLLARAVRWRLLLGPQVSLARSFWVTNIGYLVSNVLPFRLGDPARAVVIGRGGEVSIAAALSTVIVERVLDMLTVVAILGMVAPFVAESGEAVSAGIVAGAAAIAAAAVLLLMAFHIQWGRRAVRWALARIPRWNAERWARAFDGLLDGLAPLRSGRRGLALLLWSAIVWAFAVLIYWALLRAFVARPPWLAAPFLVCIVGLGMAIPSSPSAVGVFHAIARYGLAIPFGVPTDQAVTVAFAIHAFLYIIVAILGLIGLAQESLTLGGVARFAETLTVNPQSVLEER
ncbi:MAG: lysylphosphatidylglycerol synthase transmembrane domain-containing protein [Anaerolineae bacterium]